YKNANYNSPTAIATAMSGPFPDVANGARGPFQSTSSNAAPAVPPTFSVDKVASACPDPLALAKCKIALSWTKPSSDTATPANRIGVEWYVLTRESRVLSVGGSFTTDTSFGTNGQKEINCPAGICAEGGFSQTPPANPATFTDDPPYANGAGQALEYRYTVAAK